MKQASACCSTVFDFGGFDHTTLACARDKYCFDTVDVLLEHVVGVGCLSFVEGKLAFHEQLPYAMCSCARRSAAGALVPV